MINGHEAVGLGLPSGTMWATCNVGAEPPEEEGPPFAYSETKGKSTYNWENYPIVDFAEGMDEAKISDKILAKIRRRRQS